MYGRDVCCWPEADVDGSRHEVRYWPEADLATTQVGTSGYAEDAEVSHSSDDF